MAIEIIPKPKVKPKLKISLIEILYYFSVALLFLALLSYFGLEYLIAKSQTKLEELKTKILEKETIETRSLEQDILNKKKKIDLFADLINSHKRSSHFFEFLKGICHKKAFFSKITLDVSKSGAEISGQTENFEALGEQLLIFQKEKLIKDSNLTKISIGKEGEIEFDLVLSLDPEIFK